MTNYVIPQVPLGQLIDDYFDAHIRRLIVGSGIFTEHVPTQEEIEEAAFAKAVLENPADDTARKVFADWLEEHDRRQEAAYLRSIRREKFVRRVRQFGGWALRPLHLQNCAPPVDDIQKYWQNQPPDPSPRLMEWLTRLARGWRPSCGVRALGYYEASRYYGVYIWEYLNVIRPWLDSAR